MTCARCRFSDKSGFECRFYPPRYVETVILPKQAVYGPTLPTEWCGQFEAREESAEIVAEVEKRGPGRPRKS